MFEDLQTLLQLSPFSLFLTIVCGAVFGSFASFLGYRLFNKDKDVNIYGRHSICCYCKHKLSIIDLIPFFSYILLQGKCRYCKKFIPIWHFLAEIFMVISFAYATYHFQGINQNSLLMCIICFCLITQSIIDTRVMMSSDALHAVEFVSVFLLATNIGITRQYIISCYIAMIVIFFLFGLIMQKILKKECLGFGDIKLFAILAPVISIEKMPFFFALCGGFGIIIYFLQKFYQQKNKPLIKKIKSLIDKDRQPFPFIPAIYFAFLLAFYF